MFVFANYPFKAFWLPILYLTSHIHHCFFFFFFSFCRWSLRSCRPWRIRQTLVSRPTQQPPSLTSLRTVPKPYSFPIWTALSSTFMSSWSPNYRRCVMPPIPFISFVGLVKGSLLLLLKVNTAAKCFCFVETSVSSCVFSSVRCTKLTRWDLVWFVLGSVQLQFRNECSFIKVSWIEI